eukprot:4276488-Prymnesium_polylepis.3
MRRMVGQAEPVMLTSTYLLRANVPDPMTQVMRPHITDALSSGRARASSSMPPAPRAITENFAASSSAVGGAMPDFHTRERRELCTSKLVFSGPVNY